MFSSSSSHVKQSLLDAIKKLPVFPIAGGGYRFGGTEQDPTKAVVSLVPCSNYRTKTLTALVCSSLELHLYTVIITKDVGVIRDEIKGEMMSAINTRLAEYGDKIRVLSSNGVHMDKKGDMTSFVMGKTVIINFKEANTSNADADGRSSFEVPYRNTLYKVSSDFFSSTKALDNIYSFIHSLIPNVYAG